MSKRIQYSFDGTVTYSVTAANVRAPIDLTSIDTIPAWDGVGNLNFDWPDRSTHIEYIVLNFQGNVLIDKMGWMCTDGRNDPTTVSVEVSTNSSDGVDGDWTEVLASTATVPDYKMNYYTLTPFSANWMRIRGSIGTYFTESIRVQRLMLFGNYDAPNYEFWDGLGVGGAKLTANYLNMDDAPNSSNYSDYEAFTIKNTNPDLLTHTYVVTVETHKFDGDTFIDNYFTLSDKGNSTTPGDKLPTITVTDLAADAYSTELRIYADLLQLENPIDGYHYWYIKVVEAGL
jgi:hypothetical protein